jgi:hypothetical protein
MNLEDLLSYLACSQIWLNLHADHCHFEYNTKLPKRKEKQKQAHTHTHTSL